MTTEEMALTLGRIEAKVDVLVLGKHDHDHRLGAVEKKFWYATGVCVALVGLIGARLGIHV